MCAAPSRCLHSSCVAAAIGLLSLQPCLGQAPASAVKAKTDTVQQEHAALDMGKQKTSAAFRNKHPDAQWFPEAGLGLFIHWGICTVKGLNISWSMREGLNGRPAQITPNEYFALAEKFNPENYNPDRWIKAAKDAGFTYAVLTTRHHEGFALWPSKFGDYDTDNHMGGKDLVRPFVEACRRHGLKVGFYYSPPHWHFDRSYMNFRMGRTTPTLDADLKPRTREPSYDELDSHHASYAEMIRGQMDELLTNYGKIDVLWFDGSPKLQKPGERHPTTKEPIMLTGDQVYSLKKIRELQPGVLINPRFHGQGDFITYERTLQTSKVATEWAEYCNTWTPYWGDVEGARFRAPAFIIGQYALCRSLHINYLPSVGPKADGEMVPAVYENMKLFAEWMAKNAQSVKGTQPLPQNETASVPGTSSGKDRFLFAIPSFSNKGNPMPEDQLPATDEELTLSGVEPPVAVTLLATGEKLDHRFENGTAKITLPASKRTPLVDVVRVELAK